MKKERETVTAERKRETSTRDGGQIGSDPVGDPGRSAYAYSAGLFVPYSGE